MAFDPDHLLDLPARVIRQTITKRDTILYALGVGVGHEELENELQFVFEEELAALPTMAAVLTSPGFWQREPHYGIDWKRVLHGEQSIELHAPLPIEGQLRGEMKIEWIVDKGEAKGALLCSTRKVFDERDDTLLATVRQTSFLRGNGGMGGSRDDAPAPREVPSRSPDHHVALSTRPEQALIYRLSGDYNPLHIDPSVARSAGLPRTILHGLCTFGLAGRAVLRALCDNRPERLKRLDCRFSAPVFPGETIDVSIWQEGPGTGAFQAFARERSTMVLSHGYAEFGDHR